MGLGRIYVIPTFVLARNSKTEVLPPTICFERDLALEMAQVDEPESAGVAVYEIDTPRRWKPKLCHLPPSASFQKIIGVARNALLAAAPAVSEPAR